MIVKAHYNYRFKVYMYKDYFEEEVRYRVELDEQHPGYPRGYKGIHGHYFATREQADMKYDEHMKKFTTIEMGWKQMLPPKEKKKLKWYQRLWRRHEEV